MNRIDSAMPTTFTRHRTTWSLVASALTQRDLGRPLIGLADLGWVCGRPGVKSTITDCELSGSLIGEEVVLEGVKGQVTIGDQSEVHAGE